MDSVQNKRILIDTNVLVYCGDKDWGQETRKLLRNLKDNKNDLATSRLCSFELIKNAIDPTLREYYIKLINYIYQVEVEMQILMNGCVLYHEYFKKFHDDAKKIESMDLAIAGTIIYHKDSLLLTANRKHFPMPFWKTIDQSYLMCKRGERYELINLYLLAFDYSQLPTDLKLKD
jgi:predicted nucleic acid-binding protein